MTLRIMHVDGTNVSRVSVTDNVIELAALSSASSSALCQITYLAATLTSLTVARNALKLPATVTSATAPIMSVVSFFLPATVAINASVAGNTLQAAPR